MRHRYPLEALRWLRHKRVDREAARVAERVTRTARARAEEARAEVARQSSERRIEELSRAEQTRLDEGTVRVGELARVGEWRRGAEAELHARAQHELRARAALRTEVAAETAARCALGVASNAAKLSDADHVDWRSEREAAREHSEEEAAVEQWIAKRRPPRA